MFTGLVEEIGTVTAIESLGDSVRLTVNGPVVTSDASHGDSISINGCCLTVMGQHATTQDGGTFSADVMAESLDKTSLGDLVVGDSVNLERAMAVGQRFGGHLVQGHVDGTGRLLDATPSEHWTILRFEMPDHLARYLVDKGSITVQGTSLTVVEVHDRIASEPAWFSVSLIPTTLADTTLGSLTPGDRVNLEVDILAKHVERLLARQEDTPAEGDTHE